MNNSIIIGENSYYSPEAGSVVFKTVPYISLRCNPKKTNKKNAMATKYLEVQLEPDVALTVKAHIQSEEAKGFFNSDFCVTGSLRFGPLRYDMGEAFEIRPKLRTEVREIANGFVNGKLQYKSVLSLLFVEQEVMYVTNGRCFRAVRSNIIELGRTEEFIASAQDALAANIDHKWQQSFLWTRGLSPVMVQMAVAQIQKWEMTPKKLTL